VENRTEFSAGGSATLALLVAEGKHQTIRTMKNKMKLAWQNWTIVSVALGGIVLAAIGCTCINIQIGAADSGSGGGHSDPTPPSGGAFMPVQSTIKAYTATASICNPAVTITDKYVKFGAGQVPNPGENGFRGYLLNTNTGQILSNNTYILQWTVDINNLGCATPVAGSSTEVFFPASYPKSYKLAAHFLANGIPAGDPWIRIHGSWITQ
jgi:hypothetical protein